VPKDAIEAVDWQTADRMKRLLKWEYYCDMWSLADARAARDYQEYMDTARAQWHWERSRA
jgi:hypothetical protein